jgi:hypothetical protein
MKLGRLLQLALLLVPAGDIWDRMTRLVACMAANFPNLADSFKFSYRAFSEEMQYQAGQWKDTKSIRKMSEYVHV